MNCRDHCGACCIAPSISASIPGMPNGKSAGMPCVQLDEKFHCKIFDSPERPTVCCSLKPCREMCGNSREEALAYLDDLERKTAPSADTSTDASDR